MLQPQSSSPSKLISIHPSLSHSTSLSHSPQRQKLGFGPRLGFHLFWGNQWRHRVRRRRRGSGPQVEPARPRWRQREGQLPVSLHPGPVSFCSIRAKKPSHGSVGKGKPWIRPSVEGKFIAEPPILGLWLGNDCVSPLSGSQNHLESLF